MHHTSWPQACHHLSTAASSWPLIASAGATFLALYIGYRTLSTTPDELRLPPLFDPDTPLPQSRFKAVKGDDSPSSTFLSPCGRTIGYAQYGDLSGRAVFSLHGIPGCRLEGEHWDALGKKHHVRIITIDRPGIGLSDLHYHSTVQGHAEDVKALAEHLNLPEYGVIGTSGGGPYGLAAAYVLPKDKLKALALVVGLGPPDIGYKGQRLMQYLGFTYAAYLPLWIAEPLWFSVMPGTQHDKSEKERIVMMQNEFARGESNPKDLAVVAELDFVRLCLAIQAEALKNGGKGQLQDLKTMCRDFGFMVEDIRKDLPVSLWYGTEDIAVPLRHGQMLKERLGDNAELHILEETHGSLFVNYQEEILLELLKMMG